MPTPPSQTAGPERIDTEVRAGATDTLFLASGTSIIVQNPTGAAYLSVAEPGPDEPVDLTVRPVDSDLNLELVITKRLATNANTFLFKISSLIPGFADSVELYATPSLTPVNPGVSPSSSIVGATVSYVIDELNRPLSLRVGLERIDLSCDDSYRSLNPWSGDARPLGSRIPVLLLHGWQFDRKTCSSFETLDPTREHFQNLIQLLNSDRFRDFFKVYYAVSTTNDEVLKNSAFISSKIDELDLDDVIIVGHSMGGLIGRGVLNAQPDRVNTVITLGTPHEGSPLSYLVINDCRGFIVDLDAVAKEVCNFVRGLPANPIAATPGALDLRDPESYLERENEDKIFALGGSVDQEEIYDRDLIVPWLLLHLAGIESDAVVPVGSSVPSWVSGPGILSGYDHSEISRGEEFRPESELFAHLEFLLRLLNPQTRHTLTFVVSGVVRDDFLGTRFLGPSDLYAIEPSATGRDFRFGQIRNSSGEDLKITDIAIHSDGRIFAVSDDGWLYMLRNNSVTADRVKYLNNSTIVSMDFSPWGELYAATSEELITIDLVTGAITTIGPLGNRLTPSGDIVFTPDGRLFGAAYSSTTGNRGESVLIEIDPAIGRAATIGNGMGVEFVFGLFYEDGLFGVTSRGSNEPGLLVTIDLRTGIATQVRQLSFDAFGAGALKEVPPTLE